MEQIHTKQASHAIVEAEATKRDLAGGLGAEPSSVPTRFVNRRPFILGVGALMIVMALSGCGNSTSKRSGSRPAGVSSQTPRSIELAAEALAYQARSVHIVSSSAGPHGPIVISLALVRGRGGRGSFSTPGLTYDVLRTGRYLYFRVAAHATRPRITRKWLKTTVNDPTFAAIVKGTDYKTLVATDLFHPALVRKGAVGKVEGQNAIALIDPYGGTLYVATTGPPYPLEFIGSLGDATGKVVFDRWNAPVSLTPPSPSISTAARKAPHAPGRTHESGP
jgi:hypothetical protein